MSQQGSINPVSQPQSQSQSQSRSRSRRSRASTDSVPASAYDDRTDADSVDILSNPPLPIKPPDDNNIGGDPDQFAGNSAEEYFNDIRTTPSEETPPATPAGNHALYRRRTSSHGLSHSPSHGRSSRRTRSHSSARDVLRLLLSAEGSDSKEALALLRRAQERLEIESSRANEAERRVQEANERWRLINQARLQTQAEASKASEELRLYKLQLEAAQQQIARANDMIALTDKERAQAEDEAAKAKRLAKKYEMEREIQKAREEGRLEGLRQGLREAGMPDGYPMERRPRRVRPRYNARRALDDEDDYIDPDDYRDRVPVDEVVTIPRSRAPSQMPNTPMQGGLPRSMPPGNTPSWIRPINPRGSRTSGGNLDTTTHLGQNGRRGMDRNVTVNPSGAPDVASIVEDEPLNPLTSPLPPEQTSQINRTTPNRMPEPDFNPNPADVHPISVPGMTRSPAHPQVAIPPEGYIPRQDEDGAIRLPPPHELGQAPPTPGSRASPLPGGYPELPQREREPIARDFGYQPGQQPRSRHRYQGSVAASDDTIGNLSIISPGARPSALQQLDTIPEHDSRYNTPNSSMRQMEGAVYPNSPRSRMSRSAGEENVYIPGDPGLDAALAGRHSRMDGGPVRPRDMGGTATPRSNHSRFSGPKRPSQLTTPEPLGGGGGYTRPRTHSVASGSERSGFVGTPRMPRSGERTPAAEYSRSRPGTTTNTPRQGPVPEINIHPASSTASLQSRKSVVDGRHDGRVMSPRANRKARSYDRQMPTPSVAPAFPAPMPPQAEPPSPAEIPGMPKGFVPTSPMPATSPSMPEGAPPGFIPHSPAAPPGAPPGFVPTSPAPPGAPPGFIPTSPAPDVPPGFIPTSPAVPPPGVPPGFIPGSPAPPGFIFSAAPGGAPPGFVSTSPGIIPGPTTVPFSPLPQPHLAGSPNMGMAGALPVLVRSASENRVGYEGPPNVTRIGSGSSTTTAHSPRVSFSGPNAGFNSRAASDWDTRSAWEDRESRSPRPVRGPDLSSSIVRPGSSLSRRDRSRDIPHRAAYTSPPRSSRVGFDTYDDPAAVPLPGSSAPSIARSGRAASQSESRSRVNGTSVARSQSARNDSSSRGRIYPGTPRYPPASGLPPAGLGSPYSRRLDPQLDDPEEFEVVPSDDSANTLTTPPGRTAGLPPANTPRASARDSLYRSPAASQRGLSSSAQEAADGTAGPSLHRSASRQSLASNKSYARFDPNEYSDPAVLASGRSGLLPLPPDGIDPEPASTATAKGKKGKKKGKGKK